MAGRPRPRIAIWNSPRAGGPLRWSRDLQSQINASGQYEANLVTNPLSLAVGHILPQAELIHAAVPVTYRFWRRPLVLTVKGDYTIEKNIWRSLYPRAIRMADIVTVPSQYLKERIPELAKATVIPNAVDLEQFTVSDTPTHNPFKILVVTNFWFPEKARGVEQLLALIKQALSKGVTTNCEVTIVGDGAWLEKVKQQARQYTFKITFAGWSDPRTFFPTTNLFLYYSYHDNMPNAVLEAMAAGLPVLTNRVGAIDEMITSGVDGIIVDTPERYQRALVNLLSDSALRRSIGRAARTTIEQRFSWSTVVQRYLAIYRKLLL